MINIGGSLRHHAGRLYRRLLWWLSYKQIKASELSVEAAIDSDDIHSALRILEYQNCKYQWHFQVDKFVFRPECRPTDFNKALTLLIGIHKCGAHLLHQRFYAGIAAIYISMQLKDSVGLAGLRPWLFRQAGLTSSEQIAFRPHWRNRECPYKQIISARACLLQLSLAEGRTAAKTIELIGHANLRTLNAMPFKEVSADVLYRSTTNLLRGLLCLSFNRLECHQLSNSLNRLLIELECGRYRRPAEQAKENHLGLLIEVLGLIKLAMTSDSQALREKRLSIMINIATPCVTNGALNWLNSLESNFTLDN